MQWITAWEEDLRDLEGEPPPSSGGSVCPAHLSGGRIYIPRPQNPPLSSPLQDQHLDISSSCLELELDISQKIPHAIIFKISLVHALKRRSSQMFNQLFCILQSAYSPKFHG